MAARDKLKSLVSDIEVNMRGGKLDPAWFTDRQISIYLKKYGDELVQAVTEAQEHLDNAEHLIAQASTEAQAKKSEEDAAKERLASEKQRLNIEVRTFSSALVAKYQWPESGTGDVLDARGKFAGTITTRGGRVFYKPVSDPATASPRTADNLEDAQRGIVQLSDPDVLAKLRRLDELYRNGVHALAKSLGKRPVLVLRKGGG